MKLKSKLIAAAIALVAASGANAAITSSAGGNGELFFTIYDQGADLSSAADDRAYVRDLGSLVNGSNLGGVINDWSNPLTTAAGLAANPLPANKQGVGTIFSVAADAGLQSFLNVYKGSDGNYLPAASRLKWNIVAGDTSGSDRLLTTASSVVAPTYTQFRTFGGGVDIYLPAMNPGLAGPDGTQNTADDFQSALYAGGNASINLWGDNLGGRAAFSNAAGLGGSLGFFVLSERAASGATTSLADVRQFMATPAIPMTWTLEQNGKLIYAAVPEPETYALMLAGLGMLGFMARRRLNNRA